MLKIFAPGFGRRDSVRSLLLPLLVAAFAILPLHAVHARHAEFDGVRGQIEQLLSDMAAAAMAGDPDRYLALVSTADVVFLTEQRNWAADLVEHVPQRVEITLRSDPVVEGNEASAQIRFLWEMPSIGRRSVTYAAKFVRAESGWLYAGENWRILEGKPEARVQLLFYDGFDPGARTAAEAFPEIRTRVTADMGLAGDEEFETTLQQVKLYPSMTHLQKSIYLSYADSLGGWNEPGEAIKLLASVGVSRRTLTPVLAHEFGHVASFHYGPDATNMPWWILEGVAELVAEPWSRNGARTDRTVRNWARDGDLREWEQLSDFRGEAANHGIFVYRQGHQMMRFITKQFGAEARTSWMIAMANGATLDRATRDHFGMSFKELDALWRDSLKPQPREQGVQPSDARESSRSRSVPALC